MTRRQNPWFWQSFWEDWKTWCFIQKVNLLTLFHPKKMGHQTLGIGNKIPELCFDTCVFSKYQQNMSWLFLATFVVGGEGRGCLVSFVFSPRTFSPKRRCANLNWHFFQKNQLRSPMIVTNHRRKTEKKNWLFSPATARMTHITYIFKSKVLLPPWKFNIVTEKGWLADYSPFGMIAFLGKTPVKLRGWSTNHFLEAKGA